MKCSHCGKECKNSNSLRNHERLCKSNPNHQLTNNEAGRLAAIAKTKSCQYCFSMYSKANIAKHEDACKSNPDNKKICPVCKKEYTKDGETCSYSCSNTYFRHRNKGGFQYKTDEHLIENNRYRDLCFRHHGKACIVCGENKIVAAHHINEDHDDNRPENLVPLCPTHHQYVHSRYKDEVMPYIEQFLSNLSVV